jgi:hypothetical protein
VKAPASCHSHTPASSISEFRLQRQWSHRIGDRMKSRGCCGFVSCGLVDWYLAAPCESVVQLIGYL